MFKKNIFLNINYIFFFFVALFSTFLIFGFDFISITNTQWIHNDFIGYISSHTLDGIFLKTIFGDFL